MDRVSDDIRGDDRVTKRNILRGIAAPFLFAGILGCDNPNDYQEGTQTVKAPPVPENIESNTQPPLILDARIRYEEAGESHITSMREGVGSIDQVLQEMGIEEGVLESTYERFPDKEVIQTAQRIRAFFAKNGENYGALQEAIYLNSIPLSLSFDVGPLTVEEFTNALLEELHKEGIVITPGGLLMLIKTYDISGLEYSIQGVPMSRLSLALGDDPSYGKVNGRTGEVFLNVARIFSRAATHEAKLGTPKSEVVRTVIENEMATGTFEKEFDVPELPTVVLFNLIELYSDIRSLGAMKEGVSRLIFCIERVALMRTNPHPHYEYANRAIVSFLVHNRGLIEKDFPELIPLLGKNAIQVPDFLEIIGKNPSRYEDLGNGLFANFQQAFDYCCSENGVNKKQ